MQIYGPYRVSTTTGPSSVQRTQAKKPAEEAQTQQSSGPVDQLDLSSTAAANRMENTTPIAGGGEIRVDRVAEIRRQIADGTYETPEKLDIALSRMLDRFA